MKRKLLTLVLGSFLLASPALAQQKTVKIGFISSFSGPVAAIGNDMRNSFELALDHLGRKIGGQPVEVRRRRVAAVKGHIGPAQVIRDNEDDIGRARRSGHWLNSEAQRSQGGEEQTWQAHARKMACCRDSSSAQASL